GQRALCPHSLAQMKTAARWTAEGIYYGAASRFVQYPSARVTVSRLTHPAQLAHRFKDADCDRIRKVQAARRVDDRDPQGAIRAFTQPTIRKPARLGAEYQGISGAVGRVSVRSFRPRAEGPEAIAPKGRHNVIQTVDDSPVQMIPVIQ